MAEPKNYPDAERKLREQTLSRLFRFLSIETAVIFALTLMQGFGCLWRWGFHLNDLSFRVIIAATIGQITAMLTIAVRNIFPRGQ